MPTATEQETITFYSKHSNLLLIRFPEITEPTSTGGVRVTQRGTSYQFDAGRLEVKEGQDLARSGEQERDDDGNPQWDDQGYPLLEAEDVVTWLRRHVNFNHFFYEMGNEPDIQRPTWDEVLELLMGAVQRSDPDAVEELLAQENETHQRDSVVKASERALELIAKKAEPVLPEG